MKKNEYKKIIQETKTLSELDKLKKDFLLECSKREQKINVAEIISNISNFGVAKHIFESIITPLLSKKEGKKIINNYVKVIKENKSLKTLYAYYDLLKNAQNSDKKKTYITEALSMAKPINNEEYINGLGKLINVIIEGFNVLGDEYIVNNVKSDEKSKKICESLIYLSTTKKNIKNLNEYMNHIDKVSDIVTESIENDIDIDKTLKEIIDDVKEQPLKENIDNIFQTDDKEKTFDENKTICMEMISKQKENNKNNPEVTSKLNEIESKLNKKNYTFESFTKDILYMKELQEVLN